jgi:hypothetical protein
MKSEFTFTKTFEKFRNFQRENFLGGAKVRISPYKKEETPDLPVLDLGMDISLSCRISCCWAVDEDKPQNWKSAPVMIYGKISARRVVVDSRGQSHMVYAIEPTNAGCDNIRHCINDMLS